MPKQTLENHTSTGIYLLCNIDMSLLKVTFFAHFFFLESLSHVATRSSLIYITISNSFSAPISLRALLYK